MFSIYQKIIQTVRGFFRRGRSRHFLVSLVFGILVVLLYYLLRLLLPRDLYAYEEITTLTFIIIAVVLLFPAREWILVRILSRYDYLAFFGYDLHHLELLARHFSVEQLVSRILPEFSDWLGVSRATMAIMDSSRNHYHYYIYEHARLVGEQQELDQKESINYLVKILKSHSGILELVDESLSDEIRSHMRLINAAVIHPFVYRKGLPGFIILHSVPRHPFAERALEYFGDKSAVAIQNYVLSTRVIDSQLYEQELRSARRIQRVFHKTRIPDIDGFEIEPRISNRTVVEFFKTGDSSYYLVALSADRLTGAAGIILYGMLGSLHAILEREPGISINQLLTHLKKDSEFNREEYRIDILIAEIKAANPELTILHGGDSYAVYEGTQPKQNLLSLGWRNLIKFEEQITYLFSYRSIPIVAITYTGFKKEMEQAK